MSKANSSILKYPVISDIKLGRNLWDAIGIKRNRLGMEINVSTLPFSPEDVTAGSESEMQTVVKGKRCKVDLPIFIEQSNYLSNIRKRTKSGDASEKIMTELEGYLNSNNQDIWENSWVRINLKKIGTLAGQILQQDLLADKKHPEKGNRTDTHFFFYQQNDEDFIRIPVSYLLKLSLAQALEPLCFSNHLVFKTGLKIMDKFLNDNTSPETSSLYIVSADDENSIGENTAKEMAIRYLLGQILLMYANQKFSLQESGQEALMFFSPLPPVRQKLLSSCVSDSFYREIFMNPCLSGWDEGEKKYEYMHLCHRVLSRSQFNAVLKLKDAGIITTNLVSLPNLSNISLANNGTHVSMGSRKLSFLLQDASSGYTRYHEKYIGDLVIKIAEHFLPLFVGTYTAAPYRMAFTDFHPEKALSFLPHELDFTHLRMLWRRWQKKANLNMMGYPLTPFGPHILDQAISLLFGLKGDFVPDFRLIDYLVCILSTEKNSALNGQLYNGLSLKKDLADLGVFDTSMSLYLFEKLREYDAMGFSGFEGRHYSLFDSFMSDMASAVNLQNLIYLLAYKYITTEQVTHHDIPDEAFVESERRQIIFGSAIGIPTFFVHRNTGNAFLKRIIEKTNKSRSSRRYSGYTRVYNIEYRRALLETIRNDAADLIEMLGMKNTLSDLDRRINEPNQFAASGKLTRNILGQAHARSAMSVNPETFNQAAEKYYRTNLRLKHIKESFDLFKKEIASLTQTNGFISHDIKEIMRIVLKESSLDSFFDMAQTEMLNGSAAGDLLEKMLYLILAYIHHRSADCSTTQQSPQEETVYAEASIH
ncbi:MAG: hypothetical protein QMD11_10605 [Smithella sp.]|nr:hypothetical protein [Smithella sp.]